MASEMESERRTRREWRCKKCEAHGIRISLRGHSAKCPYVDCTCPMCENVMTMRLKSLKRRYRRHGSLNSVEFRTVRQPNGNIRLHAIHKTENEQLPSLERRHSIGSADASR